MDELPPISNFKPHCLHLDAEIVFLASRKLFEMTGNKRMLSSFVNRMLEEFVLDGDDRPEVSIRQHARELAEKIRLEKMSQRKLVFDAEAEKLERKRLEIERQNQIRQATLEAVRRIGFRKEWLRDPPNMNFSHRRNELVDEVSIAVRSDLQWRDLYPIVSDIVLEVQA